MIAWNIVNINTLFGNQLPSQRLVVRILRISSFNSEKNHLCRNRRWLVGPGHGLEHSYVILHLLRHRTIRNSKYSLGNRPQPQAYVLPDEKKRARNCNIDLAIRQPAIISLDAIDDPTGPELKPIRRRKMLVISRVSGIEHDQNRNFFSLPQKLRRHFKCHKPAK